MSHSVVFVIVPNGNSQEIENSITKALEPFDENMEVPEYDRSCYCIGGIARENAIEVACMTAGTPESIRCAYNANYQVSELQTRWQELMRKNDLTEGEQKEQTNVDKELDKLWKEYSASYDQIRKETFENHPLKDSPKEDCNECKGTGLYKSTCNPDSKWDWYSIGGRWAGWITETKNLPNPDKAFTSANYRDVQKIRNDLSINMCPVAEIPKDKIPFAILTPEGEWIERGKMGWFGTVSNEQDLEEWKKRVLEIYEKYSDGDYVAVAVDVHI